MNALVNINTETGEVLGSPVLSPLVWEGDRAPLAKAFIAAQKATEAVKKASTNPAFKSRYADLAAVVEAVVPALNEHGIGVLQFPANDGSMVSVTTTLLHESGSSVSATLAMRPVKTDPQGVGSCVTYARRYALLAMTGAAPEDDDGNHASNRGAHSASSAVITAEQADDLLALIEEVGADKAKFCAFLKVPNLASIPTAKYEEAVAALIAKRKAA